MKRTPFHDREMEINEIMKILDVEPSLITFVYGPINSGKTTLISHLIREMTMALPGLSGLSKGKKSLCGVIAAVNRQVWLSLRVRGRRKEGRRVVCT